MNETKEYGAEEDDTIGKRKKYFVVVIPRAETDSRWEEADIANVNKTFTQCNNKVIQLNAVHNQQMYVMLLWWDVKEGGGR